MPLRWRSGFISLVAVSLLVACWQIAGAVGWLGGPRSMPTLESVMTASLQWVRDGRIREDILVSLRRVASGISIGATLGVLIGLLTGRMRLLYAAIGPMLHFLRALPPVALVPFLLLIFGLSETTRLSVIALGVFFPVWVSAHEGAGQVDPKLLEVGRDLSFGRLRMYRRVILPATLPYIVAGIRTGIGIAYIMVFIAEWVGANRGIGYRLSVAHTLSSTEHMVVGLLSLGVLAIGTDGIFRTTVRICFPWLDND